MYHFELKPFRTHWNFAQEEATFSPTFDITDQENSFTISLDIPGLKREDIEIEFKENHLYVSGERKTKRPGKFSKVFTIPQNVNVDAIEAHFENGVLDLVLPKEAKSQSKKITISG